MSWVQIHKIWSDMGRLLAVLVMIVWSQRIGHVPHPTDGSKVLGLGYYFNSSILKSTT